MFIRFNDCYFDRTLLYFLVTNEDMNEILSFNLWIHLVFNITMITFINHIITFKISCIKSSHRINLQSFLIEFFNIPIFKFRIMINLNLLLTPIHYNSNRNSLLDIGNLTLFKICVHAMLVT